MNTLQNTRCSSMPEFRIGEVAGFSGIPRRLNVIAPFREPAKSLRTSHAD
ncbi:hypothetical protein ALP99_200306 [Pseudomonas syringae pv. tomato]|nr:hypothetical protein ALP99_200306 [Pseudomonas syringae pv. tomato]